MEGVVEGRELVWRRAARRDDLVPTDGAAVRLITASSWTGSSNDLGEQPLRPENEAAHLREHLVDGLSGLVQGTLEACTAALRGSSQGRSGRPCW